ncbi:uncharacterized protein LOC129578152 [Sitodiplosis mosellana]|uniref:uncharacterized protein LOC129578152 n=1 Tax=Sitodiplosis mosellana TaxID=263140 RepID=UPI002444936C|nr:uncharacterized protein LOC129578152 [Sitodiplosis mosellana]
MSRRRSVFELTIVTQSQLKQQEEPLSNEIDQNLRTLALVYPLSDAAKPLLVKNAFVKANKVAFHHVFHYLVNLIISAVEYRKRFRWPIVSSKEDADFRVAVLAYFNECHRNFKWTIGPFKMQVVHFPGGVEFMKIIVELSKAAMHTVLKENDSLHLINSNGMGLREAQAKLQAAQWSCAEWEKHGSKFRELCADVKQRTCRLQEVMCRMLINTTITEKMICEGFLADWEANQHEIIDKEIIPKLQQLENWFTKCNSFEQQLMVTKPAQLSFDKDKMSALGLLQVAELFNPQIDYDKLYAWFIGAMPELINALYFKPPWSLSRLKTESQLLDQCLRRANILFTRLDMITLELPLEMNEASDETARSGTQLSDWHLMLTPTMKCPVNKDVRLNIWEALPAMDLPVRIMQPTTMIHNSTTSSDDTSGFSDGSGSTDITAVRTMSTKLDPMAMLNTAMQRNKGLNKTKSSPRRNAFASSPSRSNMPAFHSTMIPEVVEDQLKSPNTKMKPNHVDFGPLRKRLF